jgi:hypothetical protein
MSNSGRRVLNASWDARTERNASCAAALNMLTMSRRSMALVEAAVLRCRSRSAIAERVAKSKPLRMLTPN